MLIQRNLIALLLFTIMHGSTALRAEDDLSSKATRVHESRFFRSDTMYVMSLLRDQGVQADLQLDDAQKRAIADLQEQRLNELRPLAVALGAAEGQHKSSIQKRMRAALAMHASSARRFIDDRIAGPQRQRLKQIYWQQIGPAAFSDDELAAALSLTDEQLEALGQTQAELQKSRQEDLKTQAQAAQPSDGKPASPGVRLQQPSAEYTRLAMEKLKAVLTQKQRDKFATLLGKPIVVPPEEFVVLNENSGKGKSEENQFDNSPSPRPYPRRRGN